MMRITVVAIAAFAVCAWPAPAPAQQAQARSEQEYGMDEALAKAGKRTFSSKACNACHTVGKGKLTGPDLNGVFERRSVQWLKSWLKDPPRMAATDETAKALLKEYGGMQMPDLNLKEAEIEALLHYIASEQKAAK